VKLDLLVRAGNPFNTRFLEAGADGLGGHSSL
jgi:hypothetical protein